MSCANLGKSKCGNRLWGNQVCRIELMLWFLSNFQIKQRRPPSLSGASGSLSLSLVGKRLPSHPIWSPDSSHRLYLWKRSWGSAPREERGVSELSTGLSRLRLIAERKKLHERRAFHLCWAWLICSQLFKNWNLRFRVLPFASPFHLGSVQSILILIQDHALVVGNESWIQTRFPKNIIRQFYMKAGSRPII